LVIDPQTGRLMGNGALSRSNWLVAQIYRLGQNEAIMLSS
jgi:hypothetical protein